MMPTRTAILKQIDMNGSMSKNQLVIALHSNKPKSYSHMDYLLRVMVESSDLHMGNLMRSGNLVPVYSIKPFERIKPFGDYQAVLSSFQAITHKRLTEAHV